MAVSGVNGAQGAKGVTPNHYVRNSDGSIIISFNGKQQKLTGKAKERYEDTFAKVYAVENRIAVLEEQLADPKLSESEKAKLTEELNQMKEKDRLIKSTVDIEIQPDGETVTFKLKKDINAEEFKKLFDLKDGLFREYLQKEALRDGIGVEDKRYHPDAIGSPYSSYDEVLMTEGWIQPGEVHEFSNGVKLVPSDDAGHYYPDYTGGTLYAGDTFNIKVSNITTNDPWYKFW